MLRRHILAAAVAALALSVAGFALAGCNKKSNKKPAAGDMAPPSTPVEMAAGDMGADDMRPAVMDTDDMGADDMGADLDKPKAGEMTLRMLTVGWKESAIAVDLKRSKADAKKLADKALAAARTAKTEKDFIKVVKKFSDVNKENGGKLPPFAPADSKDKAIAKAVSPLKVGQCTGIVETAVGYNIFFRVK